MIELSLTYKGVTVTEKVEKDLVALGSTKFIKNLLSVVDEHVDKQPTVLVPMVKVEDIRIAMERANTAFDNISAFAKGNVAS